MNLVSSISLRKLSILFTLILVGCFGLIFTYCGSNDSIAKQDTGFFLNLNDTVNYVGMETCKGCHSDKHSTFVHTGMGLSFDATSKSKSKGNFNQNKPIFDPNRNLYYYPFWQNNSLFISEYRLNGKDTSYCRKEKISYIIGSGQHTNSHFWRDGDFLYQAPLTYYTQKGKWDLPPGFENNNTSFHRKIDIECMACHNAMPTVNEQSVNLFDKIPLGIDCERCHGPGELHVNQKRNGILVDVRKQADRSIVNPKRLPYSLQIDICQRCHLQGNNVLKPNKKFTDFRPGMKLSDVFEVYMPKYENKDYFVMAGHADRFQQSQCFIKSNKGKTEIYNPNLNLTCINCHNPHVSVRETKIQIFNKVCVDCHNAESKRSALKNCKLATSQQIHPKGCVGCHMPASGSEDIPHVLVHDHKIQRPKKLGDLEQSKGKLLGLYAVNNPNPDNKTLVKAYISYFEKFNPDALFLNKAQSIIEKNEIDITDKIHLAYVKSDFKQVSSLSKDLEDKNLDAWTNYRIAKSFDKINLLATAINWYKLAHDQMQLNLDFGAEYANALIRNNEVAKAKDVLQKQNKIAKKHELTLLNLAVCFFKENNLNESKKHLTSVLALNPDNELANLYLAEMYIKVSELELAKKHLKNVLRIRKIPNKNWKSEVERMMREIEIPN
jgi:predicted CXXCH cytochrome family protein